MSVPSNQQPCTVRNGEKGQGLVEYAIILILVVVVVLACLGGIIFLLLNSTGVWSAIVEWGASVVAGVQAGNPTAIFIAVVALFVLAWLFFGRRK